MKQFSSLRVSPDRPYERLTITGIQGLTQAQKATLRALGAVEENETGVLFNYQREKI